MYMRGSTKTPPLLEFPRRARRRGFLSALFHCHWIIVETDLRNIGIVLPLLVSMTWELLKVLHSWRPPYNFESNLVLTVIDH